MNFKEWLQDNIKNIPLSNVWIMHWSSNPINPKSLDWHRKNTVDKPPQGRVGDENKEEFGSYVRLLDDEDEEGNIIPNNIPINPNYPKVFLDDGTHRAIIAREKGLPSLLIKINK